MELLRVKYIFKDSHLCNIRNPTWNSTNLHKLSDKYHHAHALQLHTIQCHTVIYRNQILLTLTTKLKITY